jgi:hypothetical protein
VADSSFSRHLSQVHACKVLVGNPEGRRTFGSPRRILEDNIKIDLKQMGCEGVDLIQLAQDRDQWRSLVNTVMKLYAP